MNNTTGKIKLSRRLVSLGLTGLILFTACGKNDGKDGAGITVHNASGAICLESGGKEYVYMTEKTGEGYFDPSIICRVDTRTFTKEVLCAKPDCLHDDKTCPRYTDENMGVRLMPSIDGERVYAAISKFDGSFDIIAVNADGLSKEKIFSLEGEDDLFISDKVALEGDYLYFFVNTLTPYDGGESCTLYKLNTKTSEGEKLVNLEGAGVIVGVQEEKIIAINITGLPGDRQSSVITINDNGRVKTLFNVPGDISATLIYAEDMFYFVSGTPLAVEGLAPGEKEWETLFVSPDINAGTAYFDGYFDGKLHISYRTDNGVSRRVFMPDSTGVMYIPDIVPTEENEVTYRTILARTKEYFYIATFTVNDTLDRTRLITDVRDVFVKKDDYYHGLTEYIEIG